MRTDGPGTQTSYTHLPRGSQRPQPCWVCPPRCWLRRISVLFLSNLAGRGFVSKLTSVNTKRNNFWLIILRHVKCTKLKC